MSNQDFMSGENKSQQITLNPLSQAVRIKAQQAAKEAVIATAGNKPRRSDFDNISAGEYPVWVTGVVLLLCVVMLVAAFLPSAFRLFDEGSKTFEQSIDDNTKAQIAGVSVVLLAETGAVLFTLALSVLSANGGMRWVLSSAALLSGVIAIVGNMAVAIFRHEVFTNVFVWLEALAPPLLTLATAYVLKGVALNAIGQRHKDNRLYEHALKQWEQETANPEAHPQYLQLLANEIKDALWKANRAKKAREAMTNFTGEEWSKLVATELQKDSWYQEELSAVQRTDARTQGRKKSLSAVLVDGQGMDGQPNGHGTGTDYTKRTDARTVVQEYLQQNPHDATANVRELATLLGVGKSTVSLVQREFKQLETPENNEKRKLTAI